MDGFVALYIFMLAAFTGYEIIGRVPVILHTPLMSGSNFVHGIVMIGAMVVLGHADTTIAPIITMPCTKLEPDISGVCRMTGTRPMIS